MDTEDSSSFVSTDAQKVGTSPTAVVHPLYNWPNAISVARLLSGPAIAGLILHGHWKTAFFSLAVSGRAFSQCSVLECSAPGFPLHGFDSPILLR